jgi:UDP-N-acetylglucosamine transferase subunit ALG13
MILVTVGTEQFPFDRLMIWISTLINSGFLMPEQEEIFVQYGSCRFVPQGVQGYALLPQSKFQQLLAQARVVIAHCGEGTVNQMASYTQPYILVPRTSYRGEHVDDHQVEMANTLAQQGVPVAWSPGDLVRFLADPQRVDISPVSSANVCRLLTERFGGSQ